MEQELAELVELAPAILWQLVADEIQSNDDVMRNAVIANRRVLKKGIPGKRNVNKARVKKAMGDPAVNKVSDIIAKHFEGTEHDHDQRKHVPRKYREDKTFSTPERKDAFKSLQTKGEIEALDGGWYKLKGGKKVQGAENALATWNRMNPGPTDSGRPDPKSARGRDKIWAAVNEIKEKMQGADDPDAHPSKFVNNRLWNDLSEDEQKAVAATIKADLLEERQKKGRKRREERTVLGGDWEDVGEIDEGMLFGRLRPDHMLPGDMRVTKDPEGNVLGISSGDGVKSKAKFKDSDAEGFAIGMGKIVDAYGEGELDAEEFARLSNAWRDEYKKVSSIREGKDEVENIMALAEIASSLPKDSDTRDRIQYRLAAVQDAMTLYGNDKVQSAFDSLRGNFSTGGKMEKGELLVLRSPSQKKAGINTNSSRAFGGVARDSENRIEAVTDWLKGHRRSGTTFREKLGLGTTGLHNMGFIVDDKGQVVGGYRSNVKGDEYQPFPASALGVGGRAIAGGLIGLGLGAAAGGLLPGSKVLRTALRVGSKGDDVAEVASLGRRIFDRIESMGALKGSLLGGAAGGAAGAGAGLGLGALSGETIRGNHIVRGRGEGSFTDSDIFTAMLGAPKSITVTSGSGTFKLEINESLRNDPKKRLNFYRTWKDLRSKAVKAADDPSVEDFPEGTVLTLSLLSVMNDLYPNTFKLKVPERIEDEDEQKSLAQRARDETFTELRDKMQNIPPKVLTIADLFANDPEFRRKAKAQPGEAEAWIQHVESRFGGMKVPKKTVKEWEEWLPEIVAYDEIRNLMFPEHAQGSGGKVGVTGGRVPGSGTGLLGLNLRGDAAAESEEKRDKEEAMDLSSALSGAISDTVGAMRDPETDMIPDAELESLARMIESREMDRTAIQDLLDDLTKEEKNRLDNLRRKYR